MCGLRSFQPRSPQHVFLDDNTGMVWYTQHNTLPLFCEVTSHILNFIDFPSWDENMKIKQMIFIVLQTVFMTCVQSSEGGGGLLDGMLQPFLKQFRKISPTKNQLSGLNDTGTFHGMFRFLQANF